VSEKKPFWRKLLSKLPILGLCVGIVAACLGLLWNHYRSANTSDLIATMENRLLDLRFRFRGPIKPVGKVGILAIDEKSLQKFGRWPISRSVYEKAFANLKALGTEWIGFDVTWSEPERPQITDVQSNLERLKKLDGDNWKTRLDKELAAIDGAKEVSLADQAMVRLIKNYQKIVLGYFYYASKTDAEALGERRFAGLAHMASTSGIQLTNLPTPGGKELKDYKTLLAHGVVANIQPIAEAASNFAFFNNESDADAIMRWVTLVRVLDNNLMPSLALKMAAAMDGREIVVEFDEFGITGITLVKADDDQDLIKIPVDTSWGRVLINHLGPDKTIPHFSLADAYDGKFTAEQKKQLKGMSLLLGPTAVAINDMRANPFDSIINGVENHAAVIDNVLSRRFMRRTESIYVTELLIVAGLGVFFAPLMIFARAAFSGIAAVLFLVGYYYFDKYMWFGKGEWVFIGMPFIEIGALFIGTTLYKYIVEEREKRKVKGTFSLYLSPEVIDQVLDDPDALKLGGQKRELTVFFSDVRSFTTISESLTPEKLCELMNDYFTPMTSIILRSKGVLDKYIGDAIMAFWGAPIPVPNHADVAAVASIEMLYALDKLRIELPKKGFPNIDIGIGLNTGFMSVGNMGSGERFCYTVMGDSVNLGARLEGLTKEYGAKILISQFTQAKLTRKDIFTRDLDDIRVKGKLEPVKIFEIMRPDVLKQESHIRDLIGEFGLGRQMYVAQDWAKARAHFMKCLTIRPDDGPADMYLRRIEERASEPKIENWDGVYTFTHK
jgi:adenylate cyclase